MRKNSYFWRLQVGSRLKALELARIERDIISSNLPPDSAVALVLMLYRHYEMRLQQGRRQLDVCTFVERALADGRSPAYAFQQAATLFHLHPDTVRRQYHEHSTSFEENPSTPFVRSA